MGGSASTVVLIDMAASVCVCAAKAFACGAGVPRRVPPLELRETAGSARARSAGGLGAREPRRSLLLVHALVSPRSRGRSLTVEPSDIQLDTQRLGDGLLARVTGSF